MHGLGSQAFNTARVKVSDVLITIEFETYMGLTNEGPTLIVEAIAQEVSESLSSN